ncbi:MAG: hypothetical protein ACTHKQ_09960 [Mesorhizobium sp.]
MNGTHLTAELQPGVDWRDLIEKHGTLYAAGFAWHPSPGETSAFQKRWYLSKDECDRATAETLRLMGYERPRWWQWWRWNEIKPSKEVAALLAGS